jgi:2-C-methyl-D-erythritol 4-phosphate cytidylyltransferase
VPAGREAEIEDLAPPELALEVVAGGDSRTDSVSAAFAHADSELVAVHDAARPLVTPELIDAVVGRLAADAALGAVVAATPVTDTIKRVGVGGREVVATENREHLWAAQTPQAFRAQALRSALEVPAVELAGATDEAMLVERAGEPVVVEPGSPENLKVTSPADLHRAELLLADRSETWIRRAMPTMLVGDLEASRAFYSDFLGFEPVMDEPGFLMLSSPSHPTTQLIVCSQEQRSWDPNTGRSQISVEVADVDAAYASARRLGLEIVYELTDEPWGIRRFFVADPDGTVINVNSHSG